MAFPFDGNYKSIKQCGDSDGGHMAVAIKKDTGVVWTSWSPDNISWSAPVSAGTISVGIKSISIYQESAANSTRFVVTNGSGFKKYSDAFGAEGSWTNYS